jgi:peptidoglycan/LPS O-acetylase OafA/YrhL
MTPLWTIALEEQFYLLFPVVLAMIPRISTRAIVWCAIGGVALSVLTRLYIPVNAVPYPMVWTNSLAHLDPIVLAIAGAFLWHRHRATLQRAKLYGLDLVCAIMAFCLVMSVNPIGQSFHTVWQLSATAVGSLLLIGAALRYAAQSRALAWAPLAWLGKISFGLYVFHILTGWIAETLLGPTAATLIPYPLAGRLVVVALALGLTVALAAASYYLYEQRFLRLKERFTLIRSRRP